MITLWITEKVIPHIEQAMEFRLYDHQINYLLNSGSLEGGRGSGKTTVYCIKLALSNGDPIDLRKPWEYSDGWELDHRKIYAMDFFRHEFLRIREKLKDYGFQVREVIGGNYYGRNGR